MEFNLPEFSGTAGAAFLLRTPARKSIELKHPDAVVTVRGGAPYVTVALNKPQDASLVRSVAWRIIQEAFDSYAATHRVALSTQYGNREYFLWILTNDGYHLTCVNTLDTSHSTEIRLENHATPIAPVDAPFINHPSLRYYRISQLTDDLFDAYRNAYLCLECLVSDESPRQKNAKGKGKEGENNWLKRVLGNQLSVALPGLDINTFVDEIYNGRKLVFHAKVDELFYPPHCEEREEIQELLNKLASWLPNLLKHKFGNSITGLGTSYAQGVEDVMVQAIFQFDELIFKYQEQRISTLPAIEVVEQPRRFGHLWAKVKPNTTPDLAYFNSIEFLRGGESWFRIDFEENLPLTNVCAITFELNNLMHSGRATKLLHAI